jgi:hypothetical protein
MRTMTKCFLAAVLTVTALFSPVLAQTASAQIWSSIASGCVLDSATAAKADVNSGFGTVSFKGTKLGHIRLTCPITGIFVGGSGPYDSTGMTVSFYDTDGTGTACGVRAALLRSNLDAHEGGRDIVDFDSNTGFVVTEPGTGRSTGHVGVPETLQYGAGYYWVQLDLVRSSTSCNPLAVGVHLVPFLS